MKTAYNIWRVGRAHLYQRIEHKGGLMEAVRHFTGDKDAQYCSGDGYQVPAVYIANNHEYHIIRCE